MAFTNYTDARAFLVRAYLRGACSYAALLRLLASAREAHHA